VQARKCGFGGAGSCDRGRSNGNDDVGGEPDIALFRSAQSQYHGGTFAGRRRRWKFLAFLLCRSWWPQLRLW
jgi:hypothetical protein